MTSPQQGEKGLGALLLGTVTLHSLSRTHHPLTVSATSTKWVNNLSILNAKDAVSRKKVSELVRDGNEERGTSQKPEEEHSLPALPR